MSIKENETFLYIKSPDSIDVVLGVLRESAGGNEDEGEEKVDTWATEYTEYCDYLGIALDVKTLSCRLLPRAEWP